MAPLCRIWHREGGGAFYSSNKRIDFLMKRIRLKQNILLCVASQLLYYIILLPRESTSTKPNYSSNQCLYFTSVPCRKVTLSNSSDTIFADDTYFHLAYE